MCAAVAIAPGVAKRAETVACTRDGVLAVSLRHLGIDNNGLSLFVIAAFLGLAASILGLVLGVTHAASTLFLGSNGFSHIGFSNVPRPFKSFAERHIAVVLNLVSVFGPRASHDLAEIVLHFLALRLAYLVPCCDYNIPHIEWYVKRFLQKKLNF